MSTRILGSLTACVVGGNLMMRYRDSIEEKDSFSIHAAEQHRKHWISGMHEPYIPTDRQKEFFTEHFFQFQHLVPSSLSELDNCLKSRSPVCLKELEECPITPSVLDSRGTVVVGGPPALMATAFEKGITYISSGHPIWRGSALHLEWDAESEAPTS